jgi:hypothetical protein
MSIAEDIISNLEEENQKLKEALRVADEALVYYVNTFNERRIERLQPVGDTAREARTRIQEILKD